jgi:lipopolysaccharide biosynthesis glycosyltransferase
MDKSIAIVIVGTAKYSTLANDLQKSIFEKFLPSRSKHIYLFSDRDNFDKSKDLTLIKCEHERWPLSSLNRYKLIDSIKKQLLEHEYILYFDSDLLVANRVSEFPFSKLFAVEHPQNLLSYIWDVEKNPKSTAYLGEKPDFATYVQGCLWGGESKYVLEMCEILKERAQEDLNNGIIAIWFDESHLNRYFVENINLVSVISPSFSYPESWNLNIEKLIIHRNKPNQLRT